MKRPPRVAIVTSAIPPAYGGAALRAYRLAVRLHRAGRLAFILTQRHSAIESGGERLDVDGEEELDASRVVAVAEPRTVGRLLRPLFLIPTQVAHAARVAGSLAERRNDFDIVHCFGTSPLCLYAIATASTLGKRKLLEVTLLGWDDPASVAKGARGRTKARLTHFLYRHADLYVCRSPALAESFEGSDVGTARVRVVPTPVDVGTFHPADPEVRERIRARLGFGRDQVVVLFVGIVTHRKGVDRLIAAASVLESKRRVRIVIAGPNDKNEENRRFAARMRERVSDLGLGDQVRFVGLLPNVPEYMRAADVLAFPSRREGFPNVVVEAMASGLPVVMTHIDRISDYIIEDGVNGMVVRRDTPEALAGAIDALATDEALRRRMGDAARATILERFTTDAADRAYADIYDEVSSGGPADEP